MSAAAEPFHDKLHIYLIYRARAHIYLSLIVGKNKACLYPLDVQQLVGCLRTDNRGTGKIFRVAGRYCVGITIYLRLTYGIRFCLVLKSISSEHLSYAGYISSASAQERCCFKCTHTGLGKEVVGVDHYSGIHAVSFLDMDLDIILYILQDLGYHLTCR